MAEPPTSRAPSVLTTRIGVLFTSIGNEAIHGFVDDLRRRAPAWELVGTDMNPNAAGLYRCDHGYTVAARSAPEYLDVIASLCERHAIDVVVPLSTEDQTFFSAADVRERLGGRPIVVSSERAVACANRKVALYESLSDLPELLPAYRVVRSLEEASDALRALAGEHGAALLKADAGTGGSGMVLVGQPPHDPAPAAGRRWLPVDVAARALEGTAPDAVAVDSSLREALQGQWPQQAVAYLPGDEYSVDLLFDRGESLGGVVRKRSAAIGGLATVAETVDEADVLTAAERVGRALRLSYVANIQFRRDAAGVPRLLEINPRVPGTIALTVEAGLNLPLGAICLALGERLALPAPEIGVRIMRFYGAIFSRRVAPAANLGDE